MLTPRLRADHDRHAAVAERVERPARSSLPPSSRRARRVEHQRGGGGRRVGRREAAALEEQRTIGVGQHDQAERGRHVQHQHHPQPARDRAAHAGDRRGSPRARDRRAAPPWRSRRRTGRSAGTSAGTRSRATTRRRCPSRGQQLLTNRLTCIAASPTMPGPIRRPISPQPRIAQVEDGPVAKALAAQRRPLQQRPGRRRRRSVPMAIAMIGSSRARHHRHERATRRQSSRR